MSRHSPAFDWRVSRDEVEWQQARQSFATEDPTTTLEAKSFRLSRRFGAGIIALLFVLGAGGWLWTIAQAGLWEIEQELQAAVQVQIWAIEQGHIDLVASVPDRADAQRRQQIPAGDTQNIADLRSALHADGSEPYHVLNTHTLVLRQEYAVVRVEISTQDGTSGYRQTHFYRRSDDGWQRTEPDLSMLGPWRTLNSDYFTIRHRELDATTVARAAPKLDALYAKMLDNFGSTASSISSKLIIEVTAADLHPVRYLYAEDDTVMVPSPALLNISTELTDDEVLFQSVVYPLASLVLEKTVQQSGSIRNFTTEQRHLYRKALQLWQLWESDGPLSVWRDEILRWLYLNSQADLTMAHRPLPDQYEQICRMYRVWNLLPGQTLIPLTCTSWDRSWFANSRLPTWLVAFSSFHPYNDPWPPAEPFSDTLGLETVIEYVVATYGHERLPALVNAFGTYSSWETLTQATFGISAAEFETDWQTYLAERYGSGP